MVIWTIANQAHIDEILPWSQKEKERFLAFLAPLEQWPQHKLAFVDQYFTKVARDVKKWVDDTALFVFGYLVREFWNRVVARGGVEEQIWVTSLWNLNVNIVQREQVGTPTTQGR